MIQVVYTNSKCSDLWNMFIEQNKIHLGWPIFFITDKLIPNFSEKNQYVYKDSDNYSEVWIKVLNMLNVEQFIYLQEDFILYDNVNIIKLNEYSEFLKKSDYSFVRLIKSGQLGNTKLSDTLYEIEPSNPFIFAMQATIWKTKDYIKLMETVKEDKWLETPEYARIMNLINMKGSYHYDNEPKRGGNHFDTNVYPYIATALVKGKWIMSEYDEELSPILDKNNIDKNKRGIV